MGITKEYLQKKRAECEQACQQYEAQIYANKGAMDIIDQILADLEKTPAE